MSTERIQKLLSRAGHGSRRQIEQWLADGLIKVNGVVASPGDRAGIDDKVELKGSVLSLDALKRFHVRVIAYHKPVGEVVSHDDDQGRKSVFESLPDMKTSRWISVGRLDINTCGLLLCTNDGELANRLMHPSHEVEREYAVRVLGEVTQETLNRLLAGVELEEGPAKFTGIKDAGGEGANHWYHVTLAEGRKREVRRLWESQGVKVSRLIRVRYGPIVLDRSLRPGRWRDLSFREIRELYSMVSLPAPKELHDPRKSSKGQKELHRRRNR